MTKADELIGKQASIKTKTAKWIKRINKEWASVECSSCHSEEKNRRNFCPECGAKMKNVNAEMIDKQETIQNHITKKETYKYGDKFILEIGERRAILDEYNIVGTDLYVKESLLQYLTPYNPPVSCNDCRHNGSFDTDCSIKW